MKKLIILCAAFALLSAEAVAAADPKAPAVLAEQNRSVAGGRKVLLNLVQTQIETTVDIGRIAPNAGGGGLIGAIIIAATDDRKDTISRNLRDKAEAAVAPLRAALKGFDVDALALGATKTALSRPEWFQAQEIATSKYRAERDLAVLVASTEAPQSALITYRYELSPDFSQIRVIADLTLARRAATKGKKAEAVPEVLYQQRLYSIVQLRKRSYEPSQNIANWSAENGRLAKQALTAAFSRFEQLLPYALGLSTKEAGALMAKNHDKAFAAGLYGPLIARSTTDPDDILIWAGGLVQVQAVP